LFFPAADAETNAPPGFLPIASLENKTASTIMMKIITTMMIKE